MKLWVVTFNLEGGIVGCDELKGPADKDWVIVQAIDEQSARKTAYNQYCSRTKAEVRKRNNANGQCVCGRKQDRPHPEGGFFKTCYVCAERQKEWNDNKRIRDAARKKDPNAKPHVRDEKQRIEKNQKRQRERRNELRVETLLEVRLHWRSILKKNGESMKALRQFDLWINEEVEKAL